MNTPKIRFKGFADDWEQRKVSELFRVTRGYVLAATQTNTTKTDEKPYPVYSSQTKDKGLMGYYKDYLYEDAITWTTDGANAGTVNYRAGKFYCTNVCGVLLSNEVKANQMIAEALNNVAKGYVSYVGNPKLMNNVMADIVIQIPTQAEEREMLSSLFASLDHLITLHQRKCDETKQLKKFMLQKMFPKNGEKNPEIRFEGFTDDWEQRKVSELFRVTRGYVLAATQTNTTKTDEKPYPVYSSQTKDKGLMGYYKDYLYEDAITWTTDGANAGTVNYRAGKFYCTNVCGVLLSNEVKANQMIAEALNNVAKGYVSYVGNPKLMNNVMADIVIQIPTQAEEREMLSSLFASLDHLITLHQRKCDETKQLKKFMLQKMFPKNGEKNPEIRFEGFTDDWEQRKLGEVSSKITKKNQDIVVDEVFTNSAEYGIISQRDFFDKDIANFENIDGYYIVEPNDFVYNPRISTTAPFGPIKRNKLERTGAMSPLYYVFRPHDIDLSYLECFFQTSCWHTFMRFNGNTGARSDRFAITDKVFDEMPISMPQDIEEQQKIGSYFSSLDNLITLHQRKCEKLKELKKYMLQNMFV